MTYPSTYPGDICSLAEGLSRTFGVRSGWPRLRRRVLTAVALLAVLATGGAMAAWQVHDRETLRQIQQLRDRVGGGGSATVVGELQRVNTRLQLGAAPASGGTTLVPEPEGDARLDPLVPSAAAPGIGRLCPPGVASALGQQQEALCRDLVQTELAQYAFALRMFQRAAEHHARLDAIEQRRRGLAEDDYAMLQSNSNELLALTARMDNDRDRYETYMRAYDARVAHIRHTQAALARNLFKGRAGVDLPTTL